MLFREYVVFFRVAKGPVERTKIYTWAWEQKLSNVEVAKRVANKRQVSINQVEFFNIFRKRDLLDCLKPWGSR